MDAALLPSWRIGAGHGALKQQDLTTQQAVQSMMKIKVLLYLSFNVDLVVHHLVPPKVIHAWPCNFSTGASPVPCCSYKRLFCDVEIERGLGQQTNDSMAW